MHDPLLGQQLAGYAIHELLGRGGMARVYRATELALDRDVALKVLQDGTTQTLGGIDRFLREARTLARLQHQAIVQIYNVGQADGLSYLVQELLPGPTLDNELRQLHAQGRHMEPAEVQRMITRLAGALDYAHQRGIIHRDLKPSNIMRNQQGQVMLVDFGIAKASDEGQKLTQTGLVLGTPAYLAPEQCIGDPNLTAAVDIYALGIILYELLAGRVPFDDHSALAVAMAHVNTPPPPIRDVRPNVPPAVEAVVLRALAKDPADRYPSAGALATDLDQAWNGGRAANVPLTAPAADRHAAPTTVNPALQRAARPAAPTPPATPQRGPIPAGRMPQLVLAGVLVLLLGAWALTSGDDAAEALTDDMPATAPTALASNPEADFRTPAALVAHLGAMVEAVLTAGSTDPATVQEQPEQPAAVEQPVLDVNVGAEEVIEDDGKGKGNGNGNGKDNGKGNGKGKDK